jgi:hypothetical protein
LSRNAALNNEEPNVLARYTIYKYVRTDRGWRYCKAEYHPNGKIKPNIVITGGVEEKHPEGKYFLNFNNRWIDVGEDALEAQRKRQMRLAQIEYERLGGRVPVTDAISTKFLVGTRTFDMPYSNVMYNIHHETNAAILG